VTSAMPTDYNTTSTTANTPALAKVSKITPGQVIIDPPPSWNYDGDLYKNGAVIGGPNFDSCPTSGDTYTVALTVTPTPLSRGYLYLRRNAFFDDNVDFSVDNSGMLSSSDTSSTQEITAILTEVAATASAVLGGGGELTAMKFGPLPTTDERNWIDQLVKAKPDDAAAQLRNLVGTKGIPALTNLLLKMSSAGLAAVLEELSKPDLAWLLDTLTDDKLSNLILLVLSDADASAFMREAAKLVDLSKFPNSVKTANEKVSTANASKAKDEQKKLEAVARRLCYKAISNLVITEPFYDTVAFAQIDQKTIDPPASDRKTDDPPVSLLTIDKEPGPTDGSASNKSKITWDITINSTPTADDLNDERIFIRFSLQPRVTSYPQAVSVKVKGQNLESEVPPSAGYVAFFPVAATARSECHVEGRIDLLPLPVDPPQRDSTRSGVAVMANRAVGRKNSSPTLYLQANAAAPVQCLSGRPSCTIDSHFFLNSQSLVNLYTESHFMNPQRDFFTNPHDTITFTSGLITGHKFTGQSAAKTVIDTITAPIRSIMPSTTVTQTVTVAPTGKTTTNTTTTAPPKGP
jgi:hypothetical protein